MEHPKKVEEASNSWLENVLKNSSYGQENSDFVINTFGYELSNIPLQCLFGPIYHLLVTVHKSFEDKDKMENLNLLFKIRSDCPLSSEITDDLKCFQRESIVYQKFLPGIEHDMGVPISPKFYYSYYTEDEAGVCTDGYLLIRDVMRDGYQFVNTNKNMLFVEVEEFVKFLATYHAVGHIQMLEAPADYLDPINSKMECKGNFSTIMEKWTESFVEIMTEMFPSVKCLENCIRKTCNFDPEKSLFYNYSSCNPAFLTYIQGDVSRNNILLKRDRGKNPTFMFLNWHLTRKSSAPLELMYFIYGNTDPQFRARYMDLIKDIYYRRYRSQLQEYDEGILNNPNYSFTKFCCEFDKLPEFCLSIAIQLAIWKHYPNVGIFRNYKEGKKFDKSLYEKLKDIIKEIGSKPIPCPDNS